MAYNEEYLKSLVERPQESLAVELKRWFDPDSLEGKAKIIKACIALRNHNGGFLVIGFDDETGAPDLGHAPARVRSAFHPDKVQALVTKYASEVFEAEVCFLERLCCMNRRGRHRHSFPAA